MACFAHYLAKREAFLVRTEGFDPGKVPNPPRLTEEYATTIREAIMRHDQDLVGADLEEFVEDSRAWAAAGGLFCSAHHTATDTARDGNNAANGGKRYLEPWRPWKIQRGKADPVDGFAEDWRRVEATTRQRDPDRAAQWDRDWRAHLDRLREKYS